MVIADTGELGGLTSADVDQRTRAGQVNHLPDQTSRTYGGIIRSNVLTRFNLIISVLAGVVLAVGSPVDALFAGVMVVNAFVGIVQEIRAKRTLDRLRILVAPMVTVRRDGVASQIPPEQVVLGDLLELIQGDQVPVDGSILRSESLEVDESALTGESDAVLKLEGDEVLSGSNVMSGSAVVIAERVGADAGIHRLIAQAKEYVLATSELRSGVDEILRIVGWMLVPLASLLLWSQLRANSSTSEGLISAVAGVVGLVPQGLVLLVSMALAVAVIRLAREHVVVQELHAVEGLARVDVFCVDKTGTLTTGTMQVERFDPIETDIELVRRGISSLMQVDTNPTTTLRVIGEHVDQHGDEHAGRPGPWPTEHHVPFSSARKWSGATFGGVGAADPTWVLGAPEILLEAVDQDAAAALSGDIERATTAANRVVLVASTLEVLGESVLPRRLTPRALIALSEQIRPDAAATMEYFGQQNVTIKVISGDNPTTVSAVASRIGLEHADRAVDMRQVDVEDHDELSRLIDHNAVFGRVLPEQKRAIVGALQRAGHTVAMTGDGVNDIPALKLADIGIAMDTATSATKATSQLVLLDGRFDRMPNVVAEGRRVIANMERVSALFVTKTVYAALFALTIGLSGSIFPFLPRQMSLVSELTIGLPAFFLSFRAADDACRPGYLRRVLRFALPAGVAAGLVTLTAYWVARSSLVDATLDQSRSASTIALVLFAFWVLYVLMTPVDRLDAILLSSLITIFVVGMAIEPVRDFYRLDWLPVSGLISTGAIVAGGVMLAQLIVRERARRARRNESATSDST
jgi:cation-transporting ATPase E